jgi:hypothetical protein
VGPRAGLDAVEKRIIFALSGIEPGQSSSWQYRLSYLDSTGYPIHNGSEAGLVIEQVWTL